LARAFRGQELPVGVLELLQPLRVLACLRLIRSTLRGEVDVDPRAIPQPDASAVVDVAIATREPLDSAPFGARSNRVSIPGGTWCGRDAAANVARNALADLLVRQGSWNARLLLEGNTRLLFGSLRGQTFALSVLERL